MEKSIMNNIPNALNSMGFNRIKEGEKDVFDYIHNIKNNEHSIVLFHTEDMRNIIIDEFLTVNSTRKITTACFTHVPSKFNCEHEITYDELLENDKFQPILINDFLTDIVDKSYTPESTRIACEDTAWFAEKKCFEEHQQCGNIMDQHILKNSALLCCYDPTKLNNMQLDTVLTNSKYVILDSPFSVYEKADN